MAAALRRRNTEERDRLLERLHQLERENEQLRQANEKKEDALRFLPPESFQVQYSLLVEAVYLTRQPEPEVKPARVMRRQGQEIPVRNYKAYDQLREIDKQLYGIKRRIVEFLSAGD